jgi:hypothetical protein
MIVSSIVDSYILYVVSESECHPRHESSDSNLAIDLAGSDSRPRSRRRLAGHDTRPRRLLPCNNICDVGKDGAATF